MAETGPPRQRAGAHAAATHAWRLVRATAGIVRVTAGRWAATTTRRAARWWWQTRGSLLVGVANFTVAATIALVTAALALVVEDLLPADGVRRLAPVRYAVLGAALACLYAAILWRGAVHRRTGTLFYVRLIDDTMEDWHRLPLDTARRRRMSLRSVTRWVDLPTHTRHGTIDLVDVCAEMTRALESVINDDRDDTAYTIASNMLWQPAVAVGAELPIVDKLQLAELPGAPIGATDQRERTFTLPEPASKTTAARSTVTTYRLDDLPGGDRVGLLLAFAKNAPAMHPRTVFAGWAVARCYRLVPSWIGEDLDRLATARFSADQLADLAAALPPAVVDIKRQAGTRELVVAAAMPKTLAMALGWGLAQSTCRFFSGTHLLHWDAPNRRYLPVRVHPAQPATTPTGLGS